MPIISIIVPVYNVERYLSRCLESVMCQTFQDFELITVNDGSPDHSQEIIDRFYAQYPDKMICLSQKNAGVSVARNLALDHAQGEYLVFLDSDDFIENDYLQSLYEAAEQNKADMVICGYQVVDAQDRRQATVRPDHYAAHEHEEWALRIMTICMRIYRREFWTKHHLKFETSVRGEDIPINLISNTLGHIHTIPYCGYHYVQHAASATHNLKGLVHFKLPYQAIENAVRYIQNQQETNSPLIFELCVLRILTSFIFELGMHSTKQTMDELISFSLRLLNTYFPHYKKNPYQYPNRLKIFPRYQRWGVFFFVALCRIHCLKLITGFMTR